MALPKINLPISELVLPSSGKKIKYRPFSVAEEKVLLVAGETGDPVQEMVAMKQICNNCLIETDVETLAMFDFEYLFLKLRSRSVDNVSKFVVNDPDTKLPVQLEVDIDDINYIFDEGHTKEIDINDEYRLFLKYPGIDDFIAIIDKDPEDPLTNYYIMTKCLDKLASEDEVHEFSEYSDEEIDEFLDGISSEILKKIGNFFDTMPKLKHSIEYENSEGKKVTFNIEGTRSFFT